MSEDLLTSIERFERLLRSNKRYDPEAYNFVYEALDWTLRNLLEGPAEPGRHVDGRQLLEGIRRFAIEKFGPFVKMVFENWGVRRTDDWGEIVFTLIDYDLMGKNDTDDISDFCGVYDFTEAFTLDPVFDYDEETDSWHVSYRPALTPVLSHRN